MFPTLSVNNSTSPLINIIFISEGFNQKKEFYNACENFIHELVLLPPFNIPKQLESFVNIYSTFSPLSFSEETNGRNSISFETKKKFEKLNEFSKEIRLVTNEGENLFLNDILNQNMNNLSSYYLIIILFKNTLNVNSSSYLHKFNNPLINLIALTNQNHWNLIIIKQIGLILGLGDESYQINSETPSNNMLKIIEEKFPNLLTYNLISEFNLNSFWTEASAISSSVNLVHEIDEDLQNTRIYSNDKIEFWKGGGGWSEQILRSSKNCIMRGHFEFESSQVNNGKLMFCPVCENYLRNVIINYFKHKIPEKTMNPSSIINFNLTI